ncbi:hypothetical protein ONZ45_g19450 [Pleurotus djamor]|nr:hypothetical protein ONZ45_g19450 [Pleurotus djamor]
MQPRLLFALAPFIAQVFAGPLANTASVTVGSATFAGTRSGKVAKFLGIPYAQPPTGDRRLRLPEAVAPYTGTVKADAFGAACPQQASRPPLPDGLVRDVLEVLDQVFSTPENDSEDCLFVNVITPSDASPESNLPVVVWIYGGGFDGGDSAGYNGESIVQRSVDVGQPVIYVSMNYRVSAFGFLASQEVKAAGIGNLGLQDQREALRWVRKYISYFGGDPSKVTIWGESAGAISVALQMVANNGDSEGLFRGAFMQSGAPIPVGDITNGQKHYDALVIDAGCSGSADTLQCLRQAPYDVMKRAIDKSPSIWDYSSLVLAWLPRVDGTFITENPQVLVQQGKVANVPFVTGNCDDEGSVFSLSTLNITTTPQLRKYIQDIWLPAGTADQIDGLLSRYPQDITKGSPFDTGIFNALSPQFKRIAAFQGDAVFQAPRRFFLQHRADQQNSWAFLSKRLKIIPALGSSLRVVSSMALT